MVRWIDFDTETYEFPEDALTKVLSDRTRLLAMGMASNCTGTVNDAKRFARKRRPRARWSIWTPSNMPRTTPSTCRIWVPISSSPPPTSGFGPHQGILWGREQILKETFGYKVRPAGRICRTNSRPAR